MKPFILYREGYKYQLASTYRVQTNILPIADIVTDYILLSVTGFFTIRQGYAWDGPSGPTIDTKSAMRGSLVHDAGYQILRLGLLDQATRPQWEGL